MQPAILYNNKLLPYTIVIWPDCTVQWLIYQLYLLHRNGHNMQHGCWDWSYYLYVPLQQENVRLPGCHWTWARCKTGWQVQRALETRWGLRVRLCRWYRSQRARTSDQRTIHSWSCTQSVSGTLLFTIFYCARLQNLFLISTSTS